MNLPSLLPGDPSELRLRIVFTDDLKDIPQDDTLERWDVETLHEEAEVGTMAFYRLHLDRGANAYRTMAEASEELDETAQALLAPDTGNFTEDASTWPPYIGSALLVMDGMTLGEQWRGYSRGGILATEAIHRLMAGCRGIACSPGVTDLSSDRLKNRAEFDRVTAKIARGWERIGFRLHRGNVYLLSPTSLQLEEQRGAMRQRLAELGTSWRLTQAAIRPPGWLVRPTRQEYDGCCGSLSNRGGTRLSVQTCPDRRRGNRSLSYSGDEGCL
ncbi:hypothetical protein [Streptomyces aureus]|uniref:hypothetical protein n=1 Tax=Streptomyces aureus TaxID=193461 RepID=UPI0006E1C75F|nr:hypothetical protein [Streptomyces aureus]